MKRERRTPRGIRRRMKGPNVRNVPRWAAPSSAPDQRLEAGAEVARDRAGLAQPDQAPVHLTDRHDLRSGAGEEGLVGGVNIVAVEHGLLDVVPGAAGEV